MGAKRCSHSACRSSRRGQSDLSNIGTLWSLGGVNKAHKHRDRTPTRRHSDLCSHSKGQPQSERLFSPRALEKEPTNHSSQRQSLACGMCMPNLPPPCHRPRHRPISAQLWPLNCGRLASCWGERRSQRSCLHALLRPLRPITNRDPIGSSISASAALLRLA